MVAGVALQGIGQVAAERGMGFLICNQLVFGGQRQVGKVVQGADIGRRDPGRAQFLSVKGVTPPDFNQHSLEFIQLGLRELLSGGRFGLRIEIWHLALISLSFRRD